MKAAMAAPAALPSRRPASLRLSAILAVAFLGLLSGAWAGTISEDFSTEPARRSWRVFGDTNLFSWNVLSGNLSVTWDSSQTNSYFYLPLGTILNRNDDFGVAIDLKLLDVAAGVNPLKDSTFELALGFFRIDSATRTNFFRGNSALSPNLVEFDFFPDTGFGATIWPSLWSTNSSLNYNGPNDYTILDLPVGPVLRVSMSYTSSNQTLATVITTNGVPIGNIHDVKLSPNFTDFRVDGFAIESYSDAGQNPMYGGSLLAHGFVDNIIITIPPPPVGTLSGQFVTNQWQVSFTSRTNWLFTLERSLGLLSWVAASVPTPGNGATLVLADTNPPPAAAFYRVRAERP